MEIDAHTGRPADITAEHSNRADQEHLSTCESCHDKSDGGGIDKSPRLVPYIDDLLSIGVFDAKHGQNTHEIVSIDVSILHEPILLKPRLNLRKQSIPTPLSEEPQHRPNESSLSHTDRTEQIQVRLLRSIHLDTDCRFNLGHFCSDDETAGIIF